MSYSGASQPQVLHPARLGSGDEAPPGQHRLGRLSAKCTLADARGGLDGVALSDVGCSTALLEAALRDRAARAGGAFLIDLHCDPAPGKLSPGSAARCSASVWGPSDPAGGDPARVAGSPEPMPVNVDARGPAAPLAPAFGAVEEAWRVLVDYWPVPGQKVRTPVGANQVGEIDFPRVGFTRLGDVRARADASCSLDTVRGALRAAAARVGATSVVGVRCIAEGDTRSCVASVAAAEVDEPIAEAR